MVKIRYAELPAGLHVVTEDRDGCTIVYLQPGLTPPQRRAALTFARRSARIGHGPSLPAVDMALAVAADRTRTTGRTIGAVLRRHPILLLPLVAGVSAVIVVTMMSFVTVSLAPPRDPGTGPAPRRTSGQPSSAAHDRSPDSTGASRLQASGSTTPTPRTVPATVVQQPVSDRTSPAADSDTPSASGDSAGPARHGLCIKVGRTTICLRS
jgi:hypothetical protein